MAPSGRQVLYAGLTTHLIAEGLDEGDVLSLFKVPQEHTSDIKQLGERFKELMWPAMTAAVMGLLNDNPLALPQSVERGEQYFVMHPSLFETASQRHLAT